MRLEGLLIAGAAVVFNACGRASPPVPRLNESLDFALLVREDSVAATGFRIYRLVRAIDQVARPNGEAPATLQAVAAQLGSVEDVDAWGRKLWYQREGSWFEVRSSGSDGVLSTVDDIVAIGRLGLNDPCQLWNEYRVVTHNLSPACADPPASFQLRQ